VPSQESKTQHHTHLPILLSLLFFYSLKERKRVEIRKRDFTGREFSIRGCVRYKINNGRPEFQKKQGFLHSCCPCRFCFYVLWEMEFIVLIMLSFASFNFWQLVDCFVCLGLVKLSWSKRMARKFFNIRSKEEDSFQSNGVAYGGWFLVLFS